MSKELMASLVLGGMLLVSQAIEHPDNVSALGSQVVEAGKAWFASVADLLLVTDQREAEEKEVSRPRIVFKRHVCTPILIHMDRSSRCERGY